MRVAAEVPRARGRRAVTVARDEVPWGSPYAAAHMGAPRDRHCCVEPTLATPEHLTDNYLIGAPLLGAAIGLRPALGWSSLALCASVAVLAIYLAVAARRDPTPETI